MLEFAKRLFAKGDAPQIPKGEAAWSESSLYRSADFPKYNPDALLSRKGYGIYQKMMTDEQVKAVVRFKRDAITSRDWTFELDDTEMSVEQSTERKQLFTKIVAEMDMPFTDALNGILSAMYNGFSITEKVLRNDLAFNGKNWVGVAKLKVRPCDTFFFHVDEFGNIERVTQKFNSREHEVDINRCIHYVQNPDYDDHYGRSELRECYRAWFSKDMVIKFQNIHLERFAAGFVWAQPKDGKTLVVGTQEYTSLQQVMSNLQGASAIILPSGIELNIEHPATTDAFERAISQHDKSIAKALLVPNLMGISEQGSVGSYSQSQTQLEAFLWTLEADATRLEAVLNAQLFKQLGDLNYGDGVYPKLKFKPISDTRKLEIVKIWKDLVVAGAVQATDVDEAYIRDALELPKKVAIEGDAPDLILNGSQITSLVGIVGQVGAGALSPEAAKALITAVFPITEEQAAAMVDSAKVEAPETVEALPPATDANGTPLTPAQEETIVGKMGISVSAFRKMFWNEDQPRGEDGRWGEGGSALKDVTFGNAGQKISGISDDEKVAFESYFDDSSGNDSLRSARGSMEKLHPDLRAEVERMDNVIRRAEPLKSDITVYRGVRDSASGLSEKLKSGAVVSDAGFQSWTESRGVANDFSTELGNGGFRMQAVFRAGSQSLNVGGDQREIITHRNQSLKLQRIDNDGVYHVEISGD